MPSLCPRRFDRTDKRVRVHWMYDRGADGLQALGAPQELPVKCAVTRPARFRRCWHPLPRILDQRDS
jgi:hypothetical protein